ncbi:MAG: hypothetical protein IPQ00_17955 [Chloracidobacterium sp.]|nr:hypothetical protein [Chloracidobacterium sp.]
MRATYSGYIDWRSSDRRNSGREFFNASFYSGNGGITIVGYRVARARAISPPGDTPDISADAVAA